MSDCRRMGFDFGLEKQNLTFKTRNRWLFKIPNVSAHEGVFCLPPAKAGRPGLSFKELDVQHLSETVYLPGKPEWKTINLVLYDIASNGRPNPVYEWLKDFYDPETGFLGVSDDFKENNNVYLELYNGCGEILESWNFESVWPQNIEFGDLDMDISDILTCDLTLRYDRAYLVT